MGKKKKERVRSKGERTPALHLQPDPRSERADVWPMVVEDMHSRNHLGKVKYGIPLRIYNGRDALVDAYQEVLDLSVYLRQEIAERQVLEDALEATRKIPGFEKVSMVGIGETLERMANKIEELTRHTSALSATLIHYRTQSTYLTGKDDGVEQTIAAVEKLTGEIFTSERIKEIYDVIESNAQGA